MSWNHGYDLDEYQTRTINGGDHGITWRDIFKCQSFTETLFGVPWSQRFFLIFHRMGELRESREVANTIRGAARDTVRRLTKTSLPHRGGWPRAELHYGSISQHASVYTISHAVRNSGEATEDPLKSEFLASFRCKC